MLRQNTPSQQRKRTATQQEAGDSPNKPDGASSQDPKRQKVRNSNERKRDLKAVDTTGTDDAVDASNTSASSETTGKEQVVAGGKTARTLPKDVTPLVEGEGKNIPEDSADSGKVPSKVSGKKRNEAVDDVQVASASIVTAASVGNKPSPVEPLQANTPKRSPSMSPEETGSNGDEVVLVAPTSYANHYDSIVIRVDIEQVIQPPNVVRDTHINAEAVQGWVDKFRVGQYGDGRNYITVSFLRLPKVHMNTIITALGNADIPHDTDIKNFLKDKDALTAYNIIKDLDYYYCDGMHRGHAIKIVKSTTVGEPLQGLIYPLANLVFRTDELLLGYLDMRMIGSGCNKTDAHHVEMTMRDSLQNTLSLIHDIKNMDATTRTEEVEKFPVGSDARKAWIRYTSGKAPSENVSNLMLIASHLNVHEALKPKISRHYCIAAYGIIHVCGGAAAETKRKELLEEDAKQDAHLATEAKQKGLSDAEVMEKQRLVAKERAKRLPPARANEKELLQLVEGIKRMDVLGAKNLWIEFQSMVCQKWMIRTALLCMTTSEKTTGRPPSAKSEFARCVLPELIAKVLKIFWNAIIIPVNERKIPNDKFLSLTAVYNKRKRSKNKAFSDPNTVESYFNNWIKDQNIKQWKTKDQHDWEVTFKKLVDKIRLEVKEFADHSPADLQKINADRLAAAEKKERIRLRKMKSKANELKKNKKSGGKEDGGEDAPAGSNTQPRRSTRSTRSGQEPKPDEEKQDDTVSGDQVVPTYPPGAPGLIGEAKFKNQGEFTNPFWRTTTAENEDDEDYVLLKPWLKYKDFVECNPNDSTLRDKNGFRITHTFDGGKGILFDLPKIRDGGWKDVNWGTEAQTDIGDYLWYFGSMDEMGGLPPGGENLPIRLMEDYQNPWVHLDHVFKLEVEPALEAVEYDFVRNPPIPSKTYNPTCSPQKVLRCLGMRPPHRAFFHLEMDDIREIRNYLGIYFLHTLTPSMCRVATNAGPGSTGPSQSMFADTFINFFRSRRALLDSRGYIVFDNILNPAGFDATTDIYGYTAGSEPTPIGEEWKKYAEYFESFLPAVEDFDEENLPLQLPDLFSAIRDGKKHKFKVTSDGNKVSLLKDSRLITNKGAVTNMFEEMSDKEKGKELMMAKIKKDFINMQLLHWLRAEESSFDASSPPGNLNSTVHDAPELIIRRRSPPALYCPDTGSRLIMNTSSAGNEQIAHTDYVIPQSAPLDPRSGGLLYPPYFVETTSEQVTPIWVMEHSHEYAAKPAKARERIGQDSKLKLRFIPPWSIAIFRGDLDHGGGSGKMAAKYPGSARCPRAHFYGGRLGIGLPDSINDKHSFAFKHAKGDMEIVDRAILDQLIVRM